MGESDFGEKAPTLYGSASSGQQAGKQAAPGYIGSEWRVGGWKDENCSNANPLKEARITVKRLGNGCIFPK